MYFETVMILSWNLFTFCTFSTINNVFYKVPEGKTPEDSNLNKGAREQVLL
jgi:hypothetical protein